MYIYSTWVVAGGGGEVVGKRQLDQIVPCSRPLGGNVRKTWSLWGRGWRRKRGKRQSVPGMFVCIENQLFVI